MKGAYLQAGRLLYKSHGRLLLIEALLLLLLLLPAYFLICEINTVLMLLMWQSALAVTAISALTAGVALAYSFFVVVPFFCGLLRLSHRLAEGREASLGDLFYAFSSRKCYCEAQRLGRSVFLGGALLYLVLFAFYLWLYPFLLMGVIGFDLFAVFAAAVLLLGYFFLPLTFVGLRRALGRTGGARRGLALRLAFFPWLLLGLATCGILLLLDVLPRLLILSAAPLDSNAIKRGEENLPLSDK